MRTNFIVLMQGTVSMYQFSELARLPEVTYLDAAWHPLGKVMGLMQKIHLSYKVNKVIPLPCKSLWKRYYTLNDVTFKDDEKYVVLGTDTSFHKYAKKYLIDLKNRNVSFVLYIFDPVSSKTFEYEGVAALLEAGVFDLVYSFDKQDAATYGYKYFLTPCTRFDIDGTEYPAEQSDLFFLGSNKNRLPLLLQINERMLQQGGKPLFLVAGVPELQQIQLTGLQYTSRMPYEVNIAYTQKSNCLLEVLQEGQNSTTLRYCEAIMYGKKLLTNNKNVIQLPFYNPKYIRVFEKPEDIDVEWVCKKEEATYDYNNEFSPVRLLEDIKRELDIKD